MKLTELTKITDEKIKENEGKVVFSFYELNVKYNLSKEEQEIFLKYAKTRLNNLGYTVYLEGDKYFYEEKFYDLTPQEKLVAIREKNNS